MDAIIDVTPIYLQGFLMTLQLLVISGISAFVVGIVIATMRISPVPALRVFATVYTASSILSGAVIAGCLSWLAVRGLARTGALDRFASGRETTARV